jgi:hypothetical protein
VAEVTLDVGIRDVGLETGDHVVAELAVGADLQAVEHAFRNEAVVLGRQDVTAVQGRGCEIVVAPAVADVTADVGAGPIEALDTRLRRRGLQDRSGRRETTTVEVGCIGGNCAADHEGQRGGNGRILHQHFFSPF